MVRSAAAGTTSAAFLKWEEVFSTNDSGRREVRYYLKRRDGTSDMAVVGKEKKSGHNITTSSSCRYRYAIREKSLLGVLSNLSFEFPSKLRSRREVIDWLSSIVADRSSWPLPQPVDDFLKAGDTLGLNLEKLEDDQLHKMVQSGTEFLWMGSSWICRKKRKHYEAYSHNGVRITVHDFVYVLAEEGKQLVAYLDDMYEDSRGNKMVVVRWFHKVDEVGLDLHCSYNDREILFSLCLQDLSIECIDGLAAVLSPQHYKKFLEGDKRTKLVPFVCRNQFDNEDVKPFDITQVEGYWKQEIHKCMFTCPKFQTINGVTKGETIGIRLRKRLRQLKDTDVYSTSFSKRDAKDGSDLPVPGDNGLNSENRHLVEGLVDEMQKCQYTIGSQIEVLSQDSGIRGCWFRAVIVKKHKDRLKVQYQDIKDAADESINLEEWILSSRAASSDQLSIRVCGRMTIRPSRLPNNFNVSLIDLGSIVDAWLHDGWWEGIVVRKEHEDRVHVYFPEEKLQSTFRCRDLRYSEEWLGDRWKQMEGRPDLLSSISSAIETTSKTTKSLHTLSILAGTIREKKPSFGHKDSSIVQGAAGRDFGVVHNSSKADLLANLKWNWSSKKRHGRNPSQRLHCYASNNNRFEIPETRKHHSFFMPSSLKVDHDNCKFIRDSSHFCPPVVSALTSLVMSS